MWNVLCIDNFCRRDVLFGERSGERSNLAILDPYIANTTKEKSQRRAVTRTMHPH